jgi:carboxyl-terminal processing protease
MRRTWRRAILAAAISGTVLSAWMLPRHGIAAEKQQVASVAQLEGEAWREARVGHFDRTDQILGQAASLSQDPTVQAMAAWSSSFKSQLESFAAERHQQYDKLIGQAKLLLEKDKPDYAMDIAARAYLLADDKSTFTNEPWLSDLLRSSAQRAGQYDAKEDWIKSLRLYADLGALEPSTPKWKDNLKLATRRVRLLFMYSPASLKVLQDLESKDREQVEQLLHPTTQPSTKPAKSDLNDNTVNDSFRADWHETLRGVQMDMLWEALVDADQNYYRGVSYKDLALGGINGLRAVLTTQGLEKAFPKLADADRKAEFIAALDKAEAENQNAPASKEQKTLGQTLSRLRTIDRDTVDIPQQVLVSEFADGAFEKLDPFTSMIWPSDLEEFTKTTQGKFSGVGIQIQTDEDGSLRVATPLEDSPAYKAGIKAGDIISKIDGKTAKGISLNQAVRTITGAPNTIVTLTIKRRDGSFKDFKLHRETIHVASVKGYLHKPGGGWDYTVDRKQNIGYIHITNFTNDTASELNSAIETMKLQHVRGIIMDLRYNPGGLLIAATDVVDKFLGHGVIVSTRPDRDTGNQPTIAMAKPDPDDCDLPLVVLVNQLSASASEIVSGALKDDHRAIIVGERTFGKGSVQMLFPLADRAAYLKLTTSHYYLPSGRCIHREENSKDWGVDPDVTIAMTPEQMRAAMDARQDLDILHDAAPAGGEQPKLDQTSKDARDKATTAPAAKPDAVKKDLLASDPQLSAALLLLRLQLNNGSAS